MRLDTSKTMLQNITALLNSKASRTLSTSDITVGNPTVITPGAGNGNKNTQVVVTIANSPGTTTVQYNRLAVSANGNAGDTSVNITVADTVSTLLDKVATLRKLIRSEITTADTVPGAGNTKTMTIVPVANSLAYTGSLAMSVVNTSIQTVPNVYVTSRGLAAGGTGLKNAITNTLLTITGTHAPTTGYSSYSDYAIQNGSGTAASGGDASNAAIPFSEVTGVLLNNFTIELNVLMVAVDTVPRTILSQWANETVAGNRFILYAQNGKFYFAFGNGTTTQTITASGSMVAQRWYHLAVVRNGNVITLYQDGAVAGSITLTTPPTDEIQRPWLVGRYYTSVANSTPFASGGNIAYDELTVWRTVRYTAAFVPKKIWDYDIKDNFRITVDGLADLSTVIKNDITGNTLTNVGGIRVSTARAKNGTGSLYFNGTDAFLRAAVAEVGDIRSGDFSLSFDAYPESLSGIRTPFALWNQTSVALNYIGWIVMFNGTSVRFYFGPASASELISDRGTLVANAWNSVKVLRKGSVFHLYLNGIKLGADVTNASTSAVAMIPDVTMGSYYNTSSALPAAGQSPFQGNLDNVRVRKGAETVLVYTP